MTNPNDFADEFDSARSGFVGPDDLLGRLILVLPTEKGQAKGNDGTMYEFVIANTLVLTGEVTDKLEGPFPMVLDTQRFSASALVNALKPKLISGKPLLGRIASTPSKYNSKVDAYFFTEPTEEDKQLARVHVKGWLATARGALDPFATA